MKTNEGLVVVWVWWYDEGEEWNIFGADPYTHKSIAQAHLSQKKWPKCGVGVCDIGE